LNGGEKYASVRVFFGKRERKKGGAEASEFSLRTRHPKIPYSSPIADNPMFSPARLAKVNY